MRGRVFQARAIHLEIERQDRHRIRRQVHALVVGRHRDRFVFELHLDAHALARRHFEFVLVVVDEKKPAVAVDPRHVAKILRVTGLHRLAGPDRDRRRDQFGKAGQEVRQRPEGAVRIPQAAELTDGRKPVVAHDRHPAVVIERTASSRRVGAPMVDIHAEHASPAGRAGQQGYLRTLRRNDRAPFRLDGAPGAQFHVAEGITPELWRLAVIVGKGRGHGGGTCAEKRIDARGCEEFPERRGRTAPCGGGEERRIHARLLRHFLEPEQMPFVLRGRKMAMPVAGPGERVFPDHRSAPEFVLRLNRNDRAAVLEH